MPYDYIEEYQKQDDETIWEFRDKDAQSKIDISLTETDYANPLSLETMQAQTAKNTKIKIEPIQDLHGFDKPWVGGAGKNKFKLDLATIKEANTNGTWTGNVFVKRGVTFTVNIDPDSNITNIKINGTAEDGGFCDFNFFESTRKTLDNFGLSIGSTYIFTNGYVSDNTNISLQYNGSINNIVASKNGTTFTVNNSDIYYPQIRIAANTVISNLYVYPMVRLSTETDPAFAPYTNICPISGHDQIDILGCGKNICSELEQGGFMNDGTNSVSDIRVRTKYYIPVIPGESYTISGVSTTSGKVAQVSISYYTKDDYTTARTGFTDWDNVVSKTITIPNDIKYIRILLRYSDNSVVDVDSFKNVQAELGSTVTEYEPYQESNNLSIDLPSTVYGGVLDLESGELVVDKKYMTCNGTEDWVVSDSGKRVRCDNMLPDAQIITDGNIVSDLVCNMYPTVSNNATYTLNYGISLENKRVFVSDGNGSMDATAFKSLLSSNNLQLAYPLATPFTLYISPEHLKLLKAQNNLTTSQYTQIKVVYRNGVFALLDPATETTDGLMSAMDKLKLDGIDSENISLDLLSHAIVLQKT